jgi:hypothetical protein
VPRPCALEPGRVEHGDARQQQKLDERQQRTEQPREGAEAREQRCAVVHLAQPALAPPQADDRDRIGRHEHGRVRSRDPAPRGPERHVAYEGDGAWNIASGQQIDLNRSRFERAGRTPGV